MRKRENRESSRSLLKKKECVYKYIYLKKNFQPVGNIRHRNSSKILNISRA